MTPTPFQQILGRIECYELRAEAATVRQLAEQLFHLVTVSLSRLLQRRGKREDARRMLAEVNGCLTQGFATPDCRTREQCSTT